MYKAHNRKKVGLLVHTMQRQDRKLQQIGPEPKLKRWVVGEGGVDFPGKIESRM